MLGGGESAPHRHSLQSSGEGGISLFRPAASGIARTRERERRLQVAGHGREWGSGTDISAVAAQLGEWPTEGKQDEVRGRRGGPGAPRMLWRPRLAPGYRKGDLPHSRSGSPPTQHRPCAKPAGQVGGSPVRGFRSGAWGGG